LWLPENLTELQVLLSQLKNKKFYILANGTNVLLNKKIDRIICLKLMPKDYYWKDNEVFVTANVSTNELIHAIIDHNYSGVEGLLGIPGSIGAAIIGNSGSGQYAISDYLKEVCTINYKGIINTYSKKMLQFGRRYSILQNKKEIIIGASFKFTKSGINQEEINKTLEFRKNFPKGFSVGGWFKNWHDLKPYEKKLRKLKSKNLKISKLLNVIISNGKAQPNEIINFIKRIQIIVKKPLKLEIKLMGFR
jgi:UDP-N-acetylmuramate dehydrogenase